MNKVIKSEVKTDLDAVIEFTYVNQGEGFSPDLYINVHSNNDASSTTIHLPCVDAKTLSKMVTALKNITVEAIAIEDAVALLST